MQVQVFLEVGFEESADFYRAFFFEGDAETGGEHGLGIDVEDLGLWGLVDDGEVTQFLKKVEFSVPDDAVFTNLDQDGIWILITGQNEDDTDEEDQKGKQKVAGPDGVGHKEGGDDRHPKIPTTTPLIFGKLFGFPGEGALLLGESTQYLGGVGHNRKKYTMEALSTERDKFLMICRCSPGLNHYRH